MRTGDNDDEDGAEYGTERITPLGYRLTCGRILLVATAAPARHQIVCQIDTRTCRSQRVARRDRQCVRAGATFASDLHIYMRRRRAEVRERGIQRVS